MLTAVTAFQPSGYICLNLVGEDEAFRVVACVTGQVNGERSHNQSPFALIHWLIVFSGDIEDYKKGCIESLLPAPAVLAVVREPDMPALFVPLECLVVG
jgi:hypothetical protein